MDKNRFEQARQLADIALKDMPEWVEKIRYRVKPINMVGCYQVLRTKHEDLAICAYFVHGDIQGFKQHLYSATQIALAFIGQDDGSIFASGKTIFSALLSDNEPLIDVMARLAPPQFVSACHNPLYRHFETHMWQLAIQGDHEALQAKVERLAKNGRKADRALPAQGKDFFTLLMRGDKPGLEDLIHQHALIKSADPLTEDFMSFLGCMETKLCWLKGIPVQIDSPLVPMELMPIEPLAHYDDVYDFLQPGWVPPEQGLMGKVSRWFKK